MEYKINDPEKIKKYIESTGIEKIKELTIKIANDDEYLETLFNNIEEDKDWPVAVSPILIIDQSNQDDQEQRAKNIVELAVEAEIENLNVLDFGCGAGFTTNELLEKNPRSVIGYDPTENENWKNYNKKKLKFTSDYEEMKNNGPYDFILIYDVLDHLTNEDPKEVLQKLGKLLTKEGLMFIRCHPFTSPHATHLYYKLNKAYLHLIFPEKFLEEKGLVGENVRKVIHPMFTYKNWITKAELSIIKEDKIIEPVDEFFTKNPFLTKQINKHYKNSPFEEYKDGKGDLSRILSFHFCDFLVGKN